MVLTLSVSAQSLAIAIPLFWIILLGLSWRTANNDSNESIRNVHITDYSHNINRSWENPLIYNAQHYICIRKNNLFAPSLVRQMLLGDIYFYIHVEIWADAKAIWAATRDFQQCGATSKASDQPEHMLSLIRAFASRLNILRLLSYWLNIIWSF